MNIHKWRYACGVCSLGLAVALMFGSMIGTCRAQQVNVPPTIISASVPIYPNLAREARVHGTVQLHITTDGHRVSDIHVGNGPAMLVRAAEQNVKTWQFEMHDPASFEATFLYELLPSECDSHCHCGDVGKNTVLLRLPTEVRVTATEMAPCEPIPDLTKPAVVNLTVKLNGEIIVPPRLVTLTVGDKSLQIPVQNGRFQVPPEVLQAKSVGFSTIVGQDQIQVDDIFGGKFTEGSWTLMLADKRFPDDFQGALPKEADPRSACILVYQSAHSEGTFLVDKQCRSQIKK